MIRGALRSSSCRVYNKLIQNNYLMDNKTITALIVINTLCIGIAGLRLASHEAWFEAILILIALVANLLVASKN